MGEKLKLESEENAIVGYVQFPLTQKGFNDFVSNLLGEPQRVQGGFDDAFIVEMNGIEKLYITILQRINQQNKANLIEFVSKIYFENETSITLKSIEGLTSYRNLEDSKVIALELVWNFLIKFEDKEAPEKQTIRIRFNTTYSIIRRFKTKYFGTATLGGISYEISYTARTWGIDIENIVRSAIKSTFIQKNKLKETIKKIKTPISIFIPAIIYMIIFGINSGFVNLYLNNSVQNIVDQISIIELSEQFSFVAKYMASVPWYQFTTYNNLFLIVMLCVCIVFGIILDDILEDALEDKSFIFLADNDKTTIMQQIKKELGKQKLKYFMTLVANVICGVLSNFLFQMILKAFGLN